MLFRSITLQDANNFLPLIEDHFALIHTLVAEGQLLQHTLEEVSADGLAVGAETKRKPRLTKAQKERKARLEEIEELIRRQVLKIQQYGAVVKSVFPARVDFLSLHHSQPVFLCWQMGESQVGHWHPVDEGYKNRRSILNPAAFGPEVVH